MVGLLDKYGKEILPNKMIDIFEIDDSDNFVTVKVYVENNESKYAVYNMEGEEIVPPVYDYIYYGASEKCMVVRKDWKANLVDKTTGKEVLSNSSFSDIWYINDKYFAGGSGNSFRISNFDGQQLTLEEYSSVSVINVDGENLLAAQSYYESKGFDRKFDYFKQTKGPSSWAVEEVSKAIENNLVPFEYQAAFTFNIKRSEFCSIIVSFLEKYYNTTRGDIIRVNKIDLVNPSIVDEFSKDIAICLNFGIVKGRGNGIFDGFSEITREEAAVMLTNLAKYLVLDTAAEEAYLSDKFEVSAWAMDAVNFVLQNKIMHGVGNDMFSPKSNLTREQTYIIMYRMLNDITNKIEIAQENGVTLLANKATDDGLYKGFTVQTRDKSQNFSSWISVNNPSYTPAINIADVDGMTVGEWQWNDSGDVFQLSHLKSCFWWYIRKRVI